MRSSMRIAAGLALAVLLVGLVPAAAAADGKAKVLKADLTGATEVPGPGDDDGRGKAKIVLTEHKVCFVLQWRRISAPVAAHIHAGRKGVAGPIVVNFLHGLSGPLPATLRSAAGCVRAGKDVIRAIAKHPAAYYVNVHTADFPDGAIRGQLHRGAPKLDDLDANLKARLVGSTEVPGPGDPDGSGIGLVRAKGTQVCFVLVWRKIAPPTAAHIHAGRKGVAGPIVVNFLHGLSGTLPESLTAVDGCVKDVDRKLVKAIKAKPGDYYINVHNAGFPDGAIRGQLRRAA
jgi:CHRD domain